MKANTNTDTPAEESTFAIKNDLGQWFTGKGWSGRIRNAREWKTLGGASRCARKMEFIGTISIIKTT